MSKVTSFETGMLAFKRSIQITEGFFYAVGEYQDDKGKPMIKREPIEVTQNGVRGQSSEDSAKNPGLSNIQTIERAIMPAGFSSVEMSFSMKFLPESLKPSACDVADVVSSYKHLSQAYADLGGYEVLADLYLWNIANGRFAWRNRFQSDKMAVSVVFDGGSVTFDPLELDLEMPTDLNGISGALVKGTKDDVLRLSSAISESLSTHGKILNLDVIWSASVKPGQEIFPSQEFVREEKVDKTLSRVLAKLPVTIGDRRINQASMHSQKIGAAIRSIDIWHGSDENGAVPVNPYAGVQESGVALRKEASSFYGIRKKANTILDSLVGLDGKESIPDQVHFMMANLVRGGVFGGKNAKTKKDEQEKAENEGVMG